jgi:hypothetical protein
MTELIKMNMDLRGTLADDRKKFDTTAAISKSNIDRSGSPSSVKKQRSSMKKGKRVSFNKTLVDTVIVESFKKYNIDMSYEDSGKSDTIKCKCLIY